MKTNEIIPTIEAIYAKFKSLEEEHLEKKKSLEEDLEKEKAEILSSMGLAIGDEVTLDIHEYRDDRISCFCIAQSAKCFIHGVIMKKDENGSLFISPILKKKNKKRCIYFNEYLSWDLKKDDKIILSHRAESFIIPGKYSEQTIAIWKEGLIKAQSI